ncbi:hypothetical protein [Rhodococcoides navarretei]|uniref:Uncharacterized protein n=1 Tax=Rhodococcus navarretei TaxID=3128981 RepID=A0ABU9CR25_9NOCA
MKYNYSGPWPIFAVLGVIVFWVLFQVVAPDASVGRAIASPIAKLRPVGVFANARAFVGRAHCR